MTTNNPNETGQGKSFANKTPDEVERSVEEKVRKGVSAVTGAMQGFNEEMEKGKVAENAKKAMHETGRTTRDVATTAKDEAKSTRDSMKGGSKGQ